jgi:dTMP kinase
MESEALEFHRRVFSGYNTIAAQEPERYVVISADGDPQQISQKIVSELQKRCRDLVKAEK